MLKNKFFTILLALMFISPVLAEFEEISPESTLTPIVHEDIEQRTVNQINEELPKLDVIPHKQPVSKKKIAKKFLLAMSGVGISSFLIFFILTIYNKIRDSIIKSTKEMTSDGKTSLVTPVNLTDAIKTFLDKTKWN